MATIIIADGLTKEFLSVEQPFAGDRRNVGRAEIDRLLGRGREYGHGPLITFLRAAVEKQSQSDTVRIVLLKGDGPVLEIFQPIAEEAAVIPSDFEVLPWRQLWEEISGDRAAMPPDDRGDETRFVVVGCQTEGRIFALASYLRNVLGFGEVAVSPHLAGSSTQDAHFAAFRHSFPQAGVHVFLDLEEIAAYAGIEASALRALDCQPPAITPQEVADALPESQRRILELLCLNWTRAEVRPLAGGFSGSLLLLANGWKGQARTEPQVLKVDSYSQMRRELDGYHQVKDFFGKHVPTFGYPVTDEDSIGVGMELAAMEGSPLTLQDTFERAESDQALNRFLKRLTKSLDLLSDKLYRNTRETTWVVPYRSFGLHAEEQVGWLVENANLILSYLENELPADSQIDPEQLAKLLRLIASNPDGIDSEICLAHGDLNYANVICDEGDNVWFIDWTHSGYAPVELDFAKLESDVKFVMSKAFDTDDLARLRELEEYLVDQRIPGDADSLPDRLKFAKWDLRYRKVLETVRRIRRACFELKSSDDWLVYRVALLRYAAHTLSFDKRRGRGECEPVQLMHALYSVQTLLFNLLADDFHLKIRAERPPGYPPRQRISIDESPWLLDCEGYDPPYHVDPSVLANDRSKKEGGWADPEDFSLVHDLERVAAAKFKDDEGRPLNPLGRTGLAGRGLLGLWGPNLAVAILAFRENPDAGKIDVMLGGREWSSDLEVTKGFMLPHESAEEAVRRVLETEAGWTLGASRLESVFEGYIYDSRQTDNAWVESQAYLVIPEEVPTVFVPGGEFDEIRWRPLSAETVNRTPPGQTRFLRRAIPRLVDHGLLGKEDAEKLLAATG